MIEANTNQHQAGIYRLTKEYAARIFIPKRKGMDADAQIFDAYEALAHHVLDLTPSKISVAVVDSLYYVGLSMT
jgi:hypothetical protein